MDTQDLRAQALALPPQERAALIEDLITSFSPDARQAMDAAWVAVAEERLRAYDEGRTHTISLEESKRRVGEL